MLSWDSDVGARDKTAEGVCSRSIRFQELKNLLTLHSYILLPEMELNVPISRDARVIRHVLGCTNSPLKLPRANYDLKTITLNFDPFKNQGNWTYLPRAAFRRETRMRFVINVAVRHSTRSAALRERQTLS